jgi:DNA-binding NtrC family response regulator
VAKTVILIDDDQDDLDMVKETIMSIDNSIRCTSFVYPEEALRVVANELAFIPDYIFIDINMPMLSGDILLAEFRKLKKFESSVITMFSTSIPDDMSRKLKEAGANFTFQKPHKFEDYVALLQTIISLKPVKA